MKIRKILSRILIISLSIVAILLLGIFLYSNNVLKTVKNIDTKLTNNEQNYSIILDINNKPIPYTDNLSIEYIDIEKIPELTKAAFISIEDKDFHKHKGLNYKRILKATLNNLKKGKLEQGASTITQQLVKNRFLTNEKTFDRKIKEAYLSKKLEKEESKNKILETYLNTIYFGSGAYGIGNASKLYFNKSVDELNISESAMLAGLIKSPSKYSPLVNNELCMHRRNIVLKEMLDDNVISNNQYQEAIDYIYDEAIANKEAIKNKMDLYTQYVLDEASQILNTSINNVLHGGYIIKTYQDINIQNVLDNKINNDKFYEKNQYGNIADNLSIIIDNQTHGVSAIAGRSKYNLVNIKRQPGSLVKPIMVFAPALEKGIIHTKTQLLDEQINIDGYKPNNVGNKLHGYISVEDTVAKSLNIPTVKLANQLGINNCISYAQKCGLQLDKEHDTGLSTVLGGLYNGVTLKDITDAYSAFTNNGKYSKSSFIKSIQNNNNVALYNRLLTFNHVFNDDTCALMTNILDYSVHNGTSKNLTNLNFDIAGKTGTVAVKNSNQNTDAYSLAYTTKHTMSVWFGNYTMEKEFNLEGSNNGGSYATKIIADTLDEIYKNKKPNNFEIPTSLSKIKIDSKSLREDHVLLRGDNLPDRYTEEMYISNRYINLPQAKLLDSIDPFEIQVTPLKNSAKISFDANDYLVYKIYRKDNNHNKLLTTIKNVQDNYVFIDKSIVPNIEYEYYIEALTLKDTDHYTTPIEKIKINKEYNKLLEENTENNLSWLFG